MFGYNFSGELKIIVKKLNKKNRKRSLILAKKIQEIVKNDLKTIDKYKNLRGDLKEYKRVHIDKSFILLFKVTKEKNFIYFWRLKHHDDVY